MVKNTVCGNGGSAAESQHMAADIMHIKSQISVLVYLRYRLQLIHLLTAWTNDFGYLDVFRQIEVLEMLTMFLYVIQLAEQAKI